MYVCMQVKLYYEYHVGLHIRERYEHYEHHGSKIVNIDSCLAGIYSGASRTSYNGHKLGYTINY